MSLFSFLMLLFLSYIRAHHPPQDTGRIIPEQYQYYCNQKCYNSEAGYYEENVACSYYPCFPSYTCGVKHQRIPFSESDKALMLHLHNSYRNLIASGGEQRIGRSQASDMNVMSYDKELEFLASCWANQCKESPIPKLGRDKCRATELSTYNGQSHWAFASEDHSIDWSDKKYITLAVMSWYEQIRNISLGTLTRYKTEGSERYEYFTQLVWSNNYLIGCGRTMFSASRFIGLSIVCNYSPGGNVQGKSVFSKGAACSKNENMKMNENYSHLCGDIRPSENDTYIPPFILGSTKNEGILFLILIISLIYFKFYINLFC
ncbi:venom allergen 5-like [Onthophagus taurus]|uniref:venom allergen 5-like n=1 Tax=Onthophagus taurus TaxID=166361 RepID=UPI0039BE045A